MKLLAIIYTGRFDDYMGNYIYRITSSINFLAWNIARLGRLDDVEVRVADWGSETPLSRGLQLTPDAAKIVRFHYIPPESCRKVRPDGQFSPSVATNVAIRRCTSKYVLNTDTDSLMPLHTIKAVFELLDGKTEIPFDLDSGMFFCMRRQLPWEIVQRQPGLKFWDRYLLLNTGNIPPDNHEAGLGGSGAGQMLTRELWHAHRGYSEVLVGQGWIDCDFTLRVTQNHPVLDLAALGVTLFHQEHWPRNQRHPRWRNNIINPYHVGLTPVENPETWGLEGEPIEEQRATNIVPSIDHFDNLPRAKPELTPQPLGSPAVARMTRDLMPRLRVSRVEWECLCALTWHASECFPLKFLELSAQSLFGSVVVGGACPGVEIYAADTWQDKRKLSSPAHLSAGLDLQGFTGYLRFKIGDSASALKVLDLEGLDLACLPWESDAGWPDRLMLLAERLQPGGMLVVRFPTEAERKTAWRALQERFPHYTHRFGTSGRTGFLIATEEPGGKDRLIDFGPPRMPRPKVLLKRALHYVRRALEDPKMFLEQVRGVFRR